MANVTDLCGSQNTQTDETSVQVGDDSNINVFEFGNLILADILPSIGAWINYIADMGGTAVSSLDEAGNSISEDDTTISNSEVYDFSEFTYNTTLINYDGVRLQGVVVDSSGS